MSKEYETDKDGKDGKDEKAATSEPEVTSGSKAENEDKWAMLTSSFPGYGEDFDDMPKERMEELAEVWNEHVRGQNPRLLAAICLGRLGEYLDSQSRSNRPLTLRRLAELTGRTTRWIRECRKLAKHVDGRCGGVIPQEWSGLGPQKALDLLADKVTPTKPKKTPEQKRFKAVNASAETIKETDTDGLPRHVIVLRQAALDITQALRDAIKPDDEKKDDDKDRKEPVDLPKRVFFEALSEWPLDTLALAAARGKDLGNLKTLREDVEQMIDAKLSDMWAVIEQIEKDERNFEDNEQADAEIGVQTDEDDTDDADTGSDEKDEDQADGNEGDGHAVGSETKSATESGNDNNDGDRPSDSDGPGDDVTKAMRILHSFGPKGALAREVAALMPGKWTSKQVAPLLRKGKAEPIGFDKDHAVIRVHPEFYPPKVARDEVAA